jgi:non-ribosomal peptide synthetase component F/acyl carrier protein
MITHEALVNYTRSAIAAYDIQPTDRVLQFASICFDASAEEIYPCLSRGATLVLRSEAMIESAESFLRKCEEWDLSVVSLPTAYWHHLTAEMEKANLQMPALLRLVIIGGERAFPERLTSWLKRISPSVRLVNTYGPTEATVVATLWSAPTLQKSTQSMAEVPIGLPLPHVQAYALDPNLHPVPVGVVGELYLGGLSLARGYLNRPDLTAQKFVPNPFHSDPASRLYKTGDLVRCLPGGDFVFVGRNDHQIKLRGYRIELGEIEAALRQHAAVGDAAVLARQDQAGEKRLVAYIVGPDEQSPEFGELRSFLRGLLPEYGIPAAFVRLAALPLTPSNKVDRRSLPAPECFEVEPTAASVAPSTPIEKRLADIWRELLAVQQVGIHDNFFDLGGHSLIATQVISRVRDTFRINLTVRSLFESPTIAKLAPVIAQSQPRAREEEAPAIVLLDPAEALTKLDDLSEEMADETKASKFEQQIAEPSSEKRALLEKWILENSAAATEARIIPRRTSSGPCALSFAQQRLWFLAQLEPDSPLYNIARAIRIRGALNSAALQKALNAVVERHQSLRSTFDVVAGNPIQVIGDVWLLELPVLDLRAMAAAEREGEIQRLSEEEARRVFNLSKDLMIRTLLLRVSEEEHVLLLTVHHIASDGWSMEILFREIASFYEDFCGGKPSRLPELPIQYADYALWQRQRLEGEALASLLTYWKNQLDHLPPVLKLVTDRPRPAIQTHRGAQQYFRLPRNLSEEIKALSRREGVTVYMTLLAAFQTLLHRYTGMDDIVVGSPIAGRDRMETEGLIGFFVNTLVLRTDLSGDPSFRELLGRVREVALGAYAHQELPFEKLVEELQPERNLSYNPLFQVLFVMQNTPKERLELAGLSLASREVESKTAKFDLSLSIRDTTNQEQELAGSLEYNTDLFESATAGRMCGHFQALLEGIVADPEQPLSTLPLMTQSERLQMVPPSSGCDDA